MKYAQIIFSPTGGTKAAAEAVTARWDGPVETVDLCTLNEIGRASCRERV